MEHLPIPDDVLYLIVRHLAAMRIQSRWKRRFLFGHAQRQGWTKVRSHLVMLDADIFSSLRQFYAIRREWRMEAESWLQMDLETIQIIYLETQCGLWGRHDEAKKK